MKTEKSGGRPKKETKGLQENKTNGFQKEETETKPNVNDNVNVNDNDNANDNVNDLYLTLFNKYKEQIEKEPNRVVQIISAMKESSDYELLTLEDQDKIFYDLMSIDKKIR